MVVGSLTALGLAQPAAAEAPRLRRLVTQPVGATTYFLARFDKPADCKVPTLEQWRGSEFQRRLLGRLPRLVPQDGRALAVYPRVLIPDFLPSVGFDADRKPVPVEGLEFVGKLREPGKIRFLLLYPADASSPQPPRVGDSGRDPAWVEVAVELDFATAERLPEFTEAGKRKPNRPPAQDDLEGLWAAAQASQLAVLEGLAPDFSFYGFACEATGRKYGVRAPMLQREDARDRDKVHRRLYETTTGSAAITESLQLHRMLNPAFRDRGQRTIDVATVRGIDIAEHPWQKMMAGKKPAPEPLARLVPFDNFYVHFKSIRKFIEFGEVLDQWGTNLGRAYEVTSRDYFIKERYEKQLCLRSGWQGKTFGPAVVKSLALTGSDGYLREGSDLTVIFHVTDPQVFLKGVEPFVQEARKEFGRRLRESRTHYHDLWLESFVTPHREVSLHRAVVDRFVIYSNSPVALRRVIDAYQGRLKALADSLDFQYMRTVFRLEDEREDGFAFLSDAFIRQLVGPVSKIKEKRRLEALTSLGMVTNAALFTAWETGKLPADHPALLAASALRPGEIYTPEGNGVTWNAADQVAVSDVYNTLHFPTPLIELPLVRITPAEEQEYERFQRDYLNLWRRYFDPVGMRFALTDRQVRVEAYILPLIRDSHYDTLRWLAGGGTAKLDPSRFGPLTLVQGTMHISPQIRPYVKLHDQDWLGNWASLQVEDTEAFAGLAEKWVRQDFYATTEPLRGEQLEQSIKAFPVTLGLHIPDAKVFAQELKNWERDNLFAPTTRRHLPAYKGIDVVEMRFEREKIVLYHAVIGDAWYISSREASLKNLIDRSIARREGKEPVAKKEDLVPINGSLYLAPSAAQKAGDALRYYLEWECHRRALPNLPIWYALYRSGLVDERTPEKTRDATAMRLFGFVPVSPDGASYAYEAKTDEVVNRRHGSWRRPQWHAAIEPASPLGRLLDRFRAMRADLRFQEDGVNTTVTIERKGK
jgi:hypothetical protein